jgi:hypothetical protein
MQALLLLFVKHYYETLAVSPAHTANGQHNLKRQQKWVLAT